MHDSFDKLKNIGTSLILYFFKKYSKTLDGRKSKAKILDGNETFYSSKIYVNDH